MRWADNVRRASFPQHTAGSHLTRFLFKTSIVVNIVAFFCYLAYYDK